MQWNQAAATIDAIAQDWRLEDGPGGAIVLFDADGLRATGAGGLADLSHSLPFGIETAVRIASVSKHFLASLLLTGTPVHLDHTLGQHLMLPAALASVRVGRALDMTAGLPDLVETLWLLGVAPSTTMNRHRLMDAVGLMHRLNFPPGSEISYSNTGYRLVQAALLARGVDYAALLQERLFRPLGLQIRLPEDATEPVPKLATGYWKSLPGIRSGWRGGRYGMHISASGGLAGNAIDLARWGQALVADNAPVPGLLQRLAAVRHLEDGRPTAYGLGLARTGLGDRVLFGHGGSLPGYRSHMLLDPEARCGVVVLSNREDTDAGALAMNVMAALHDVALPPSAPSLLPDGLFVTSDGPFWLQHRAGQAMFLGATERLVEGGGWAVNGSAPLPMRLQACGTGIIGEIGHVARRFHPAPRHALAEPGWAGSYRANLDGQVVHLRVCVEGGTARLQSGPLGTWHDLRPLDATRALYTQADGPWAQVVCACFDNDGVTLATQRSRIVRFSAE